MYGRQNMISDILQYYKIWTDFDGVFLDLYRLIANG